MIVSNFLAQSAAAQALAPPLDHAFFEIEATDIANSRYAKRRRTARQEAYTVAERLAASLPIKGTVTVFHLRFDGDVRRIIREITR